MKIALFSQWAPPEPANIVGSLAVELGLRGHHVDYVTGYPNYPGGRIYDGYRMRWRTVENDGMVRTLRVPLYPSHDRSAARRIANYVSYGVSASTIGLASIGRPDVAYVYHPPATAAWPARLLRRFRSIPFVLHIQDLWPESVSSAGMLGEGALSKVCERSVERMCLATYRAASHIIVISPGFKDALVSRGVDAEKISVVMNWTDERTYRPCAPSKSAREEVGPSGHRVVLYAGNLGDYQGLDAAVRAAATVGREAKLHLTLIGDGIARARLEELVRAIGANNVWILGRRPPSEMPVLLSAADAHLVSLVDLPFFGVTIPGKTQVALAMGRPSIVAVRGHAARLVDGANAGICCEPGEAGLEGALRLLCHLSDDEVVSMGNSGRDYYLKHLSMDRGVSAVESLMLAVSNSIS
jgi:colanic acid biosynthesis glycosyl transferase WcaI